MAKVIFTPWKEHSQLLAVRNQFYPPAAYDGPDMRSMACATVSVWKIRGNLPHAVEATALLTDAILHDDAEKNSIFSIRATYSAAFCRFVTGLVDSKLHGQRKTMFQRAVDLGLPASFVELRHEATHRELPSLTVLRNSTQRSLEWLWDYYWAKTDAAAILAPSEALLLDDGETALNDVDGDGLESIKAMVKASLGQIDDEGGESTTTTTTMTEPPRKKRRVLQQLSSVATQFVAVCRTSGKGSIAISKVLVENEVLVPASRVMGTSLNGEFAKWDRFLQTIVDGCPGFLTALVEEMVDVLAFRGSSDGKIGARCEGIYLWLDHIIASPEWQSRRQLLSTAYVRSVCQEKPNPWTTLVKTTLCKVDLEVPRTPVDGAGNQADKSENGSEDATTIGQSTTEDLRELEKFGWNIVDTWDSRPLGVV
ncbi:rRNA-processing protein las1 [Aspergillus nanangensis]|uniref:rRNA-processing protein las1 n=1 Tax=Aspergillus nanangensis TaxID=2582783 RepID=A0AAD4CXT2_ASPNN|nr:rRNA-processing protein las1 [Aspergillus nanangensis]